MSEMQPEFSVPEPTIIKCNKFNVCRQLPLLAPPPTFPPFAGEAAACAGGGWLGGGCLPPAPGGRVGSQPSSSSAGGGTGSTLPRNLQLRNFARSLDGQHLLRQHHDHRLQVMAILRMYAPERRKKGMLTLVAALEGVLECPGPLVVQQGVDGRRTGAQENYWHKEKLCPSFLVRAVLTGVQRKKWWPAQSKHLKEVSIYNMYDRYDIEYDIECELQMRHRKKLTCTNDIIFSLRISGPSLHLRRLP